MASVASGQSITEIIDATGDGAGNTLALPRAVAVDSAGNVFVTSDDLSTSANHRVFKVTPAGAISVVLDSAGDGAGNVLNKPFDIAADESGNVYVAGNSSNNVFKITAAGVVTEIIDFFGDGTNILDEPDSVAVDSAGNVFVTGHASDNAFKITPGGQITQIIDFLGDGVGGLLFSPTGIAVDGSGNVYVCGQGTMNAFRITPDGTVSLIIDVNGDGTGNQLVSPLQMVADAFGNAFVLGVSANVFRITPGGEITEMIDHTGDGAGTTLSGGGLGLAIDGAGSFFVSDWMDSDVFKVTPAGTISEIYNSAAGGGGSLLSFASGLAADAAGNVFVAGYLSSNVVKIGGSSTSSSRPGVGGNPNGFVEVSPATIGGTWVTTVDIATPAADSSVVALSTAGPTSVMLPDGELLCLPPFLNLLDVSVTGTHSIGVPSDPGLVGLTLCTQAATISLVPDVVQLQNAIDITFGVF